MKHLNHFFPVFAKKKLYIEFIIFIFFVKFFFCTFTNKTYPNDMNQIAIIDLFCGGGGFSVGAAKCSKSNIILGVDNNPKKVSIFLDNFPKSKCVALDLCTENNVRIWTMITKLFKSSRCKHLHIHGSPPCLSQTRAAGSSRDTSETGVSFKHTQWFLRFIKLHKKRIHSWSMEQSGDGHELRELVTNIIGHDCSVILKAEEFGSPSLRRRLYSGEGWNVTPSVHRTSMKDVLPNLETNIHAMYSTTHSYKYCIDESNKIKYSTQKVNGGNRVRLLSEPGFAILASKTHYWCQIIKKQKPNPKWTNKDLFEFIDVRIVRPITPKENATLMSFPTTYKLPEDQISTAQLVIGDAVCPAISKAIVSSIKNYS
jgi:site-specific DNA-cytosine methylase